MAKPQAVPDAINVLTGQLQSMWTGLIQSLPQLAIGIVLLVVTWIIAKLASRGVAKVLDRSSIRLALKSLTQTAVVIAISVVGILIAATVMIPGLTPAGILAGLGLGTVAIGFAFQDIFENFLAGILIMIREKMRIGDTIECNGMTGKVEHISLRETHLRRLSGELTIVPNSILFKNPVEIFTDQEERRHEVVVGVSYDTDLETARGVIRDAVNSVDSINLDKRVDIFAKEFNSSSVDFLVRWWAGSKPFDMHDSRDRAIRSIKRALDDANIEIPYPYVTHTFKETLNTRVQNEDQMAEAAE